MDKDRVKGSAEQAKGKVKEVAGKVLGDSKLESEGKGDQVFLWVRFVGHGGASGIPIEMELAHVYTLRDGKAARVVEYMDRKEALEAAGLRE